MREMYAFWKYDLFPFMLYGRVTKFMDNGRVQVKAYGVYSFLPIAILDGAKGRAAIKKIEVLRTEHYNKEQVFRTWKNERKLMARKIIGLENES